MTIETFMQDLVEKVLQERKRILAGVNTSQRLLNKQNHMVNKLRDEGVQSLLNGDVSLLRREFRQYKVEDGSRLVFDCGVVFRPYAMDDTKIGLIYTR